MKRWYEYVNENLLRYSYWNHDAEGYDDLVLTPSDIESLYKNMESEYPDIEDFIVDGIRFQHFSPIDCMERADIAQEDINDIRINLITDLKETVNANVYDDSVIYDACTEYLDKVNALNKSEIKLDNAKYI